MLDNSHHTDVQQGVSHCKWAIGVFGIARVSKWGVNCITLHCITSVQVGLVLQWWASEVLIAFHCIALHCKSKQVGLVLHIGIGVFGIAIVCKWGVNWLLQAPGWVLPTTCPPPLSS